ncbi:MAG TPA: aminoglycoside phosphotransferase family protein [Puia sp.]|uniref:phosphotransferase enzyme family protein n=1 Tax=Puia sp. TaxID=2045100 RepID=UPI002CB44B9F|nr:aminoglycoside phosphotransferase family protein [Puia sp.]HVU95978.1 aminoglycoside phosphotransferase family protein [Puia sp.]
MLAPVLAAYGLPADTSVTPHGSGLINRTWLLRHGKDKFILQRINQDVFSTPALIAQNIEKVGSYLAAHYPEATFPCPVATTNGDTLVNAGPGGFYRLFPFIEGSVTIDVVERPELAYEAAKQFGAFTRMMDGFPVTQLHDTLPHFHDLSLRYSAFREALTTGLPDRIAKAADLIGYLESQHPLVTCYQQILVNPGFRLRVTHHDTKISNVLFDRSGKGICVIDLDTVMAGYFISDVGDMLRTYLCPVTEEEKDTSLIGIRLEYFEAIVRGYLEEMAGILTPDEKKAFVYAGEFMVYMQALRFITDYLLGDPYYGSRYEGHNYVRALNQATLLQRYSAQSHTLRNIVSC